MKFKLLIAAVCLLGFSIFTGSARAAPGDLTFAGCIAGGGANGCTDPLPGDPGENPLGGSLGVAVSPNGSNVYVASPESHSISHFFATPEGQLIFDRCLGNDVYPNGCTNPLPGANPLHLATEAVVSPNGNHVYVASSASITHFTLSPVGQLSFAGCIANGGADGCTDPLPGQNPLGLPFGVAVSPNGNNLYLASRNSDSISHFTVAPGGQLTFAGCIADGGAHGCTNALPGQNPFNGAFDVEVSPNGNSVYLASVSSDAISHFTVAPGGQLTFAGCIAGGGANGCTDPLPGQNPLDGPTGVAVSPNGANVYLSSGSSNSISHFSVSPAGQLTFAGCIANGGANSCTNPVQGQNPLSNPWDVAVSPSGDVYLAAEGSDSISHFTVNPAGQLTFAGCIATAGANGCTDPLPGQNPLDGPRGVAVSPNGSNVYLSSYNSDSISHFVSEPPVTPVGQPPPQLGASTQTGQRAAALMKCKKKKSKKARKRCKKRANRLPA